MGFGRHHFDWNHSQTFSNPQDVSIDREGVPSQAEEEEAVKGLRANPLESPDHFRYFLRIQLLQEGQAHPPFPLLDPVKDPFDPPRLLQSEATGADG